MGERFTLRRQREALVRAGLQPAGEVVGDEAREGDRIYGRMGSSDEPARPRVRAGFKHNQSYKVNEANLEGFPLLSPDEQQYFSENLVIGGKSELNPRLGILKAIKYKEKRKGSAGGVATKYYFYDTKNNRLYETNSKDYKRFFTLKNYKPKGEMRPTARQFGKGGSNKQNIIIDFSVRSASKEDLERVKPDLTKIKAEPRMSEMIPMTGRRKSLSLGRDAAGGGRRFRQPKMRERADRRKGKMPKRRVEEKNFFMNVESRGRSSKTIPDKGVRGDFFYLEGTKKEGELVRFNQYPNLVYGRQRNEDEAFSADLKRGDYLKIPSRATELIQRPARVGDVREIWEDSEMRGLRDRRTDGGNYLRGTKTRLGFKSRYQSAIEQSIIDRRIRDTDAEKKIEKAIKETKDGEKQKIDNLTLLRETADRNVENLKLKNQKLLYDHNTLVRGNMNATLLGSDAEELNKLIISGRVSYTGVKDMVRKGEITDVATIHQLDFPTG